jgi:hypothetical protein
MMKRLTANAGMASVIHSPIEKNNRKRTYTWESVNPGSLRRKVMPSAATKESMKEIIDLFRVELLFSMLGILFKIRGSLKTTVSDYLN